MNGYEFEEWQLIAVTLLAIALGAVVCYYAFKNFARTRTRSMGFLGLGMALVSAGSVLTWWVLWEAGMDPIQCQLGTTGVTVAGFGSIIYSLRTRAG